MKLFLSLMLMLSVFALVANAESQHVVQTAPDRVVAEQGSHACYFFGPVNETIFISCSTDNVVVYTGSVPLWSGTCRTGSFAGIEWKLCRNHKVYNWDITAGVVEQLGILQ